MIINSVLGINTENSIIRSFGFVRFIILVMGINYYLYKDYKLFEEIILKLWSFLFLIVTLDLLFESIFGFNTFGNQSLATGRLSSFLGEELKIGNYYFGFVLIALSFIIYKFKNNYIFFFLTILFLTVALLIGERSNFLKILIIVPMFILLFEKKYFLKKIILLLFTVSILISIVFLNSNYKERFWIMLGEPISKDFNLLKTLKNQQYGAHFDTAYQIFLDNKLFGIGLKNFRHESGKDKYKNEEFLFTDIRQSSHPHQLHFELLSETGLIGYLMFLLFFIFVFYTGITIYLKSKNFYQLSGLLFVFATIIPLLPSGSFFTTYSATIFWINFSFAILFTNNSNKI